MPAGRKARTSVLVVDDSEVVRTKLRGLLRDAPGFQQIGESVDGPSGVEKAGRLRPDIVVMDLRMPGMSGIEATWKLGAEAPESRVLVLTVSSEEEDIADAVMAGAQGYVVKGAPDEEILTALARVAAGERAISSEVAHRLVERDGEAGAAAGEQPASRERQQAPAPQQPAPQRPAPQEAAPQQPVPQEPPQEERQPEVVDGPDPEPALRPLPTGWLLAIGLCGGFAVAAVGQGQQILSGSATDSGVWLQVVAGFVISVGVAWLAMLATQLDD